MGKNANFIIKLLVRMKAFLFVAFKPSSVVIRNDGRIVSVCSFYGNGKLFLKRGVVVGQSNSPKYFNGVNHFSLIDGASIVIGDQTKISNNTVFIAWNSIVVGKRCLIGEDVKFMDSDIHGLMPNKRSGRYAVSARIEIGDDVFIGSSSIILKGVSVGEGSIVAAGSVVVHSVPSGVVVAGNPARVVKKIECENGIET